MQTVEWTDGKLEERLDRIDERIAETSRETNQRLDRVENTMVELKQQMVGLNTTFQRGNFALITAVCGVIAAVLARGG
jgi:tetrahydromethanopterin S-methyltransferase subunit G